ncbi:MAG: HlyD family efflux transporter periplasmic adaptor subunit, partial [Bacteroidales bacterium]|nr:HlyD family efflux transporter periplasmic adaptor subunit [Bacteroidales bacterium]
TYEQNTMLLKDELIPRENYLESKESYEHATQLRQLLIERARQDSIYRKIEIENMNDNLDNIRKNLKMVRERLENLNVNVSVDGQLGMLDAELGQSISTGQRIGQINVLTDFKIEAQINEHYIDRVRRDLTASFDRQGKIFFLKVKKVYPEVREGIFNIDMVFTSEKPYNIRTGQTNHIRLQLGQPEEATLIPRGGFFQSTGGQWVYVLDETESYAMKCNIRIGRQNPQYFELLDGLEPGEKVITSSYDTFGENDRLILR